MWETWISWQQLKTSVYCQHSSHTKSKTQQLQKKLTLPLPKPGHLLCPLLNIQATFVLCHRLLLMLEGDPAEPQCQQFLFKNNTFKNKTLLLLFKARHKIFCFNVCKRKDLIHRGAADFLRLWSVVLTDVF